MSLSGSRAQARPGARLIRLAPSRERVSKRGAGVRNLRPRRDACYAAGGYTSSHCRSARARQSQDDARAAARRHRPRRPRGRPVSGDSCSASPRGSSPSPTPINTMSMRLLGATIGGTRCSSARSGTSTRSEADLGQAPGRLGPRESRRVCRRGNSREQGRAHAWAAADAAFAATSRSSCAAERRRASKAPRVSNAPRADRWANDSRSGFRRADELAASTAGQARSPRAFVNASPATRISRLASALIGAVLEFQTNGRSLS